MQNQGPKPEVPPRASNYPIQQNQNMWNNVPNARPPPPPTQPQQPQPPQQLQPPQQPPQQPTSPVFNNRSPPTSPVFNNRSPPTSPVFNNRPSINHGPTTVPVSSAGRPPALPQRVGSSQSNQVQQFQMQNDPRSPPMQNMPIQNMPMQNMARPQSPPPVIPQRAGPNIPKFPSPVQTSPVQQVPNLPQPRPNMNQNLIRNQPTTLPISQLTSPTGPNTSNNNIQINANPNIQRRNFAQKDLPPPPIPPMPPVPTSKKSNASLSRSASSIKTKFVDIVNRSLSRKFSTRRDKSKRLSSYGGMNVHSAYRNSLMVKPVFDSKLLLKPQNPNFILSLGSVFMIASVSLAIAIVSLRNGGLTESKIHDISSEDSFGFIFFSVFMLLIGLTGFIAYHKKWTSLLITYSVFLVFGLIVQIIIILLFLNIYIHPLIQMRYKWVDVLSDSEKQDIQEGYSCCGYLSVVDHGISTTKCMPDTGTTTLSVKSSLAIKNIPYLDVNFVNLRKRQFDQAQNVQPQDPAANVQPQVDPAANAQPQVDPAANAQPQVDPAANAQPQNPTTTTTTVDAGAAGAAGAAGNSTVDAVQLHDLKNLYKVRDPESYTEADIKEEGCARIIVNAIRSGLLQYIIIEVVMALFFIVAFYFAVLQFKEQLNIEKEIDSARATFG
ncbi:hypothetical protein PIROE2DRAFT_61648 [Piromyces sp. E2]|nr:hypothetical protein PIROE2DRAFT_61648 [Piromyces sp. E2]|eukprot:OUM62820.1 hypothetical protein PIROE2DRAFT_61648 [Piromyces sp. E2]